MEGSGWEGSRHKNCFNSEDTIKVYGSLSSLGKLNVGFTAMQCIKWSVTRMQ